VTCTVIVPVTVVASHRLALDCVLRSEISAQILSTWVVKSQVSGMDRSKVLSREPSQEHQGIYHQDWHIEDNLAAEKAFRSEASTLPLVHP